MKTITITTAGIFLALLAAPAAAEDASGDSDSALTLSWTPVPVLKSKDGKFEIKVRGRAYLDHAWVNDSDNTTNLSASEFRAARIGIDGKYGDKFSFRFEADFAHKAVSFKDIYIKWEGDFSVTIGHVKLASPMEGSSSSRFLPLMERGGLYNAFHFGRQMAVVVEKEFGTGAIEFGIGQGGFANKGSATTGFRIGGRIHQALVTGGAIIHLGATFSYLTENNSQPNLRYRDRAFQHLSPRFVSTARIADSQTFGGLEAGVFTGPFSLVGEVGFAKAGLAAPSPGQKDPTFWGGHITAAYFLTGEVSPYSKSGGAYARPKIKRSLFDGGTGAVQVAVRYDHLDLVDNGIFGGIQNTFAAGINWWWAPHIKWAFNYSRSTISQAFLVPLNGADGANTVNAFGIRTQIDW